MSKVISNKVVFIHIPKTAGTTFISVLNQIYSVNERYKISGGSAVPSNFHYEVTSEIYQRLDVKITEKIKLLYGHIPFIIEDKKTKEFDFITILREPISRVVSDYFYIKSQTSNPLHLLVDNLSITEYVNRHQDLQLDNLQTRMICGKMKGQINQDDLEKAIFNIDNHFSAVGFLEYFEDSLVLFKKKLGWTLPLSYKKKNTRLNKPKITLEQTTAIRNQNLFDLKLYESCVSKFLKEIENNNFCYSNEKSNIKAIKQDRAFSINGFMKKILNQ